MINLDLIADPDKVRPPYNTMFNHVKYKLPVTAIAAYNAQPALPKWSYLTKKSPLKDLSLEHVAEESENYVNSRKLQKKFRNIFGMF